MSEVEIVGTPVGVMVNGSLFTKDCFVDAQGREGTAAYKIELALPDDETLGELEDKVFDAAVDKWGEGADNQMENGHIRSPFLDGDELAAKREAKGKKGDAYKGKVVIRASTIYNKHGENAEGGVHVMKEDATPINMAEKDNLIYNGVEGVAALTIKAYDAIGSGLPGVKFYLVGFQRTGAGERLVGERSFEGVFTPVDTGPSTTGRRRRVG